MTSLQISMLLNIGSLVLGLGSCVCAIFAIGTSKAVESCKSMVFSFILCLLSLVFQLFEIGNRASIGDYAAIEDTIRAVLIASVVLVAVTIALNIVAFLKIKKHVDLD